MEVSVNDTINSRIQTFRRMDEFGSSHLSDFAPTSLGAQLIARQSTQLAELTSLLGTQAATDGAASQGTDLRANARDDLRSRLKRFSRTAHAIAIEVPGLENKFRLPRGDSDEELLAAARAAARDAVPLLSHFTAHEMPASCIDDLNASITRFEDTMDEQSGAIGDRVNSRVAINAKLEELMLTRRQLMPIMENRYADDPATLAEWTRASHIERPAKKKDDEPPQSTPPPAA
jgi:hypothetical protein